MIQVIYNGDDITGAVSVNRCIHDMYAGGQSDTLHILLNDVKNLWDRWHPQRGDTVRINYGALSTGTMFLSSASPKNGLFDIFAQSAPLSCFDAQWKSWQRVRFLQLAQEIAERNGLSLSAYGVEDHLYQYVSQEGEGDLPFLHRRAALEGCAVLVYDGRLVLYGEASMEATEPQETLQVSQDGDYRYEDLSYDLFGACIVESGQYYGKYAANNGSARVYRPKVNANIGSDAEAKRFAAAMLRAANKGCLTGYVRAPILQGYAPASMVYLKNDRAPSWNGPVFLHHVRNDYAKNTSKLFFRKPLEGY